MSLFLLHSICLTCFHFTFLSAFPAIIMLLLLQMILTHITDSHLFLLRKCFPPALASQKCTITLSTMRFVLHQKQTKGFMCIEGFSTSAAG